MNYLKHTPETAPYTGILLCGGKGSRIESITSANGEVPKPLLEVGDDTLLQHTIRLMGRRAVSQLIFAVGHKAEQVEQWVRSTDLQQDIDFSHQDTPGVLHAVTSALPKASNERVVISNTDEIRHGLNLTNVLRFHANTPQSATLVTARTNQLSRHRTVSVDESGAVTTTEKQPAAYADSPEVTGLVNAGIIVSDVDTLLAYADGDRDRDWGGMLDTLVEAGELAAYEDPDMTFFNVGTPEEYYEAQAFLSRQQAA